MYLRYQQVEEEAEVEFNEEEEAIKSYLEGGMEDMLPGEILEKVLGEFWEKEPFKWVALPPYFLTSDHTSRSAKISVLRI